MKRDEMIMKREMKLYPYTNQWHERFESIKLNFKTLMMDHNIHIEHFGSTSVVGMPSKNIIDVMMIVDDLKTIDDLESEFVHQSYIPKGEHGIFGRRYFYQLDSDGINHLVHIHCYEKNHPKVLEELMFRNYLRIHRHAFNRYVEVKTLAEKKYRFDPVGYTNEKDEIICELMKEAKRYYAHVKHYTELLD
jgi:GrpB-like predicted nucleotidyltransferase (UPF0157 family)